jgi:hypothetical protein
MPVSPWVLSRPGRFLVYDAQNFAANPDGSKRLQVIWDSENWVRNTPSPIVNSTVQSFGTAEFTVRAMTAGSMSTALAG